MRVTQKARRPTPMGVAEPISLPAPVGGWDGISPLANMPQERAYQIDNWVCRPGWIEPRRGFLPHCTGVGTPTTPVQTVMAYSGAGSVNKLFAVAAGSLYDVTLSGAAVKTTTTFGSSRLQYTMFSNPSAAMDYLIVVSGADVPRAFDGTSWFDTVITGDGFDPSTFVAVASHKGRLWFVPDRSTGVVYLETVGGFQGAASFFPLGQLMSKGGYVVAVGTWTADSNQFVDEYIAFVTSRGQVIVYQGTDPSTAGTWSLVGRYNLGAPVGRRCLTQLSGDLVIITLDGLVSMTAILASDPRKTDRLEIAGSSLTATILNPMAQAAQSYRQNFGWSLTAYAKGTLVIMNIPIAENYRQMQFVMNSITGAWTRFYDDASGVGIPANCWEVDSNDNIYFGGNDGTVCTWDVGANDNGQPINCLVKSAYSPFGNAGQLKRFTMMQALITTTGNPIPSLGVNVDFQDSPALSVEQPIDPGFAKWDEVKWDEFTWPAEQMIKTNWVSVLGLGHYVSIVTRVSTQGSASNPTASVVLQLNSWNLLAERGAFV